MGFDRFDFCRALARDAGKLAHRAFGASATTMKGSHDVVTAMDREVERFIRAAIAARYPQDAIIGEEDGGSAGERLWLIPHARQKEIRLPLDRSHRPTPRRHAALARSARCQT
jgi:3'-phosphoadenosine 5'-phosphosulfate (PAPS) 3'-phosphatase